MDPMKMRLTKLRELHDSDPATNSWTALASRIGVSAATLTTFRDGKYGGDVDSVAKKIDAYLRTLEQRSGIAGKIPYAPIRNAKEIQDLCNYALVHPCIVMVTSSAGLGKTTALEEFKRNNENVIYIYVHTGFQPHDLWASIAEEIGISASGTATIRDKVLTRVKNSNRLILIDEAHKLSYRCLECARELYDQARIGIVLAGGNILMDRITGKVKLRNELSFDQIYSRVRAHRELQAFKIDDVQTILNSVFGSVDKKVAHRALSMSRGVGRILENIIINAQVMGETKLTVEALDKIKSLVVLPS